MIIKNKQLGIRIPDEQLIDYTNFCSKINSVMSLRVRKFIELELEYQKQGKDLLLEIEKHGKK
jgi:hypothetical protein